MGQTVQEIKKMLASVDAQGFADMERCLATDERLGVLRALSATRKRLDAQCVEEKRVAGMYSFEQDLAASFVAKFRGGQNAETDATRASALNGVARLGDASLSETAGLGDAGLGADPKFQIHDASALDLEVREARSSYVVLGLDEVGRGPLAGPLAIGAVVLGSNEYIPKINDSKKLSAHAREEIASVIRKRALVCIVEFVSALEIDELGIACALRNAFLKGIEQAFAKCENIDAILLDGNAMHLHEREINVVKGDSKCASIACASIVAKVERDALMCKLSREYPEYMWDKNKGYGSSEHINAIKKYGLSPYHRKTYCTNFTQETLF